MIKLSAMLATTTALLALSGTADAADKTTVKAESTLEHSKNGGYEKSDSVKKTGPLGTVTNESETKLKVQDDGDAEKTITSEHTNDPKGLMNKHTDKTVVKEKSVNGDTTTERTRKVDGKTVLDVSTEIKK